MTRRLLITLLLLAGLFCSSSGYAATNGKKPNGKEITHGLAVDYMGNPVVDPTKNVLDLVGAESRRQDDMRIAEARYNEASRAYLDKIMLERQLHANEMADLRDRQQKELRIAEAERLNSIRQVDREEVAKTAATSNLATSTLAKQTTDLATTLQTTVQSVATAAENRRTADNAEFGKRVSALELTISAGGGKEAGIGTMGNVIDRVITIGIAILGAFGVMLMFKKKDEKSSAKA